MDVDRTRIDGFCIFVTPDLAEEFGTRNGMVAVVPEVFKNFNFLAGECQLFCTAHARVFTEVHAEVAGNKLAFIFHRLAATAEHCFDTCKEHRYGERLRDVVVGTELETVDDIVIGILCRKDDDREALVLFANLVANGKAVHAREHEVQQYKSVLSGECFGKAAFAVNNVFNAVTVELAEVHEAFGNGNFIFDDEDVCAACILSHSWIPTLF